MSHQTGITASADLKAFFGRAKGGSIRFIKISIINETLTLEKHIPAVSTWQNDYDKMIVPCLEDKKPCYILYRLDTKNNLGYEWLFICWSPDFSPVREKMLYAATRATLKTEFGGGYIKEELFGTVLDDVSLNGFQQHLESQHAPAPLTYAEEELEMIRKNEVNVNVNVDTKNLTMQGLAFPVSNQATEMILRMRDGKISYIQLSIDIANERIELDLADNIQLRQLPSKIPKDHARYHFFNFQHTHEGDFMSSIVFIYSTPGYVVPIKERMLYSSCKSRFLLTVEKELQIEIAKKIEISDGSELTEEFLLEELHPKKNIARQAFAKPKGPLNRGPRRMIRPESESSFN